MATGLTNNTSLNDLIGSLLDELVQEYSYAQRVIRPLIRYAPVPEGNASIVVPRFGSVDVASLTQATAPTAQQLTSDGVTLTPAERGVLVTISKQTLRADPFSDLEPYARTLAKALGEDEDGLVLTAMAAASTGFTNTVNNGAGAVDMTLTHFRTALAYLLANNAPMPYFAVLKPASWAKIMPELDDAGAFDNVGRSVVNGAGGPGQPVLPGGFVAAPYGVPIYISSKVDGTRDTNETYANVMFSSEGFALATTFDHRVDTQEVVKERAFDAIGWYAVETKRLVDTYGTVIEDQINA